MDSKFFYIRLRDSDRLCHVISDPLDPDSARNLTCIHFVRDFRFSNIILANMILSALKDQYPDLSDFLFVTDCYSDGFWGF